MTIIIGGNYYQYDYRTDTLYIVQGNTAKAVKVEEPEKNIIIGAMIHADSTKVLLAPN